MAGTPLRTVTDVDKYIDAMQNNPIKTVDHVGEKYTVKHMHGRLQAILDETSYPVAIRLLKARISRLKAALERLESPDA